MAATLSCSLFTGTASQAVSDEAQFIQAQMDGNWVAFQRSRSLGNADLFDDLEELAEECSKANWDGFGAMAVDSRTVEETRRFLRALPMSGPRPTLGAEPDGHVTFEWHVSPRRTLSVSIGPDGLAHYAATIGPGRSFGTEPFLEECPDTILGLIQRIGQR